MYDVHRNGSLEQQIRIQRSLGNMAPDNHGRRNHFRPRGDRGPHAWIIEYTPRNDIATFVLAGCYLDEALAILEMRNLEEAMLPRQTARLSRIPVNVGDNMTCLIVIHGLRTYPWEDEDPDTFLE